LARRKRLSLEELEKLVREVIIEGGEKGSSSAVAAENGLIKEVLDASDNGTAT